MKHLSINLKKRGIPYDIMIDRYYNEIVNIISLGKDPGPHINKHLNHPLGHYCNYDRSTPRYWWCNFVPALFNLKGEENHTIEIRNHNATLDFIKIRNWILICLGIVSYVDNFKTNIIYGRKNVSLSDVLLNTFPYKGKYLLGYVNQRTNLFMENPDAEEREYKDNGTNYPFLTSTKGVVML
jgi:hypothetical protein